MTRSKVTILLFNFLVFFSSRRSLKISVRKIEESIRYISIIAMMDSAKIIVLMFIFDKLLVRFVIYSSRLLVLQITDICSV